MQTKKPKPTNNLDFRESIEDADFISKLIDYDDWIVKNSAFNSLTKKWGKWERWTQRFEEVKPLPAEVYLLCLLTRPSKTR